MHSLSQIRPSQALAHPVGDLTAAIENLSNHPRQNTPPRPHSRPSHSSSTRQSRELHVSHPGVTSPNHNSLLYRLRPEITPPPIPTRTRHPLGVGHPRTKTRSSSTRRRKNKTPKPNSNTPHPRHQAHPSPHSKPKSRPHTDHEVTTAVPGHRLHSETFSSRCKRRVRHRGGKDKPWIPR